MQFSFFAESQFRENNAVIFSNVDKSRLFLFHQLLKVIRLIRSEEVKVESLHQSQ